MIQRKQTIYLLLALVAIVVCMTQPIGVFDAVGMAPSRDLYNLYISNADIARGATPTVFYLFFVLLLCCPLIVWAIFDFKHRRRQVRLAIASELLCIVWLGLYCRLGFVKGLTGYSFMVEWAAALPCVAIVFLILAQQAIQADERLVRAADRIR